MSSYQSVQHTQTNLQFRNNNKKMEISSYLSPLAPLTVDNKDIAFQSSKVICLEDDPGAVIVKFHVNSEVFATAFKGTATIGHIKESLADILEEDENSLILEIDRRALNVQETLVSLGALPNTKISLQVNSTGGHMGKALIETKVKNNIPTLEVITVHMGQQGDQQDIVVEIENQCCSKEWLGGYRHQLTNIEYHNAITQTAPIKKECYLYTKTGEAIPLKYCRDTQTVFKPRNAIVSTSVNKATQMSKSDLFINSKTDKIITSKHYEFRLSMSDVRVASAIIIQRSVREWIAKSRLRRIVELETAILTDMKRQKDNIAFEQAKKERAVITGTVYPVNRDDFYRLYLMVSNWWKREWKRICDLRTVESKKAEAVALLSKEVKLLETIEKHRIIVKREALKKEKVRFLDQCSQPSTFKNTKGHLVSIVDMDTQRAEELREMYIALSRKDVSSRNRMDVLMTFKNLFIKNYMEYEYANDLVSLINREIDLLTIGIKLLDVKVLHKRIKILFMNFLEQKQFNPKVAKYKKRNTPKTIHWEFQCKSCLKMLPASKFPVHVRMKAYRECTSCTWLQNIGGQRVDMSPYLKLLKAVQNSEMEKCCHSSVCFILQPIGMGHLTKVIWHGHSAISECSDMTKLIHIRWLSDIEWAPWNTILLTDQEAKYHSSIPNVFTFYDKSFIEMVRQRHILARITFIELLNMSHDIEQSGVWSSIKDSGSFLHPSHAQEFASEGVDYENDTL